MSAKGILKVNYLWDENEPLPQLALERDGTNATLRRYVFGRDLISMRSGSADYYYLSDLVGSVANLTSSSGTAEWTYAYNPFGDNRSTIKNDPNAPTNLMRFDSQLIDTVDNLYDLRARMDDPGLGRFLEMDPVEAPLSQPRMASYVYAEDRPTTLTDPSGRRSTKRRVPGLPLLFPKTIDECMKDYFDCKNTAKEWYDWCLLYGGMPDEKCENDYEEWLLRCEDNRDDCLKEATGSNQISSLISSTLEEPTPLPWLVPTSNPEYAVIPCYG